MYGQQKKGQESKEASFNSFYWTKGRNPENDNIE